MDEYLLDLIGRMDRPVELGKEKSLAIHRSDSWMAFREAERLDQAKHVVPLVSFIETEQRAELRGWAYFILGHIAKNGADAETTQYLISRVGYERDRQPLIILLERIKVLPKPEGMDVGPILELLKYQELLVRHSAIRALDHCSGAEVEEALADALDESKDPEDFMCANEVLGKIGTLRSIPFLEKRRYFNKRGFANSVGSAVAEITKRCGTWEAIQAGSVGRGKEV